FLLVGALSNLAVFALRFYSFFEQNGLEPTTGREGVGSFGIYQVCTGAPLYHDFMHIPNAFAYNFLFYDVYGYLVRLLSSCNATPLIGRFITLSFLAAAACLVWLAARQTLERVEASVVTLAMFSPAIGWWAFALRPDVGAIAFLVGALLCFAWYLNYPR